MRLSSLMTSSPPFFLRTKPSSVFDGYVNGLELPMAMEEKAANSYARDFLE
jgi:hypothetical protein